jgi:hypothetical protein
MTPAPMPCSEDSEKGLISSILKDPAQADICLDLPSTAFYIPANGIIFEIVREFADNGSPLDFPLIKQAIIDAGQLEEIGGAQYLNALYDFVPCGANASHYIKVLKVKHAQRKLITLCKDLIIAATERGVEIGPLLADAQKTLGDIVHGSNGSGPPRILQGASLLDYFHREINYKNTLLGNRFLCRGGGLFIVAPSGHGKSVMASQSAIQLACNLPAFGIKNPNGPLKSLIIQSEDDDGDLTEMAQIIAHLELSTNQQKMVDENTHIEFVNDATGDEFLNLCDGFLSQWKADLLWINPYTAYLGGDIKDDAVNTRFLRNGLNRILTTHKCGGIPIHHTPKTNFRDTSAWKPSDWMYSGAGAAVLTNWARAYLVIDPTDTHGVYKFIAAKRGKRIGWGDAFPVYETFWAHSRKDGQLLWLPADQDQIASAKPSEKKTEDDLLPFIPVVDPISQERIRAIAKEKLKIGVHKTDSFLKLLAEDEKIAKNNIKRNGVKSGVGYTRKESNPYNPVTILE